MDINRQDIYLTYALWLAYEKDYSRQALEMVQKYLKKHPGNRLALFIKYVAYTRINDKQKATESLKQIKAQKGQGFIEDVASKILVNYGNLPK